MLILFQNLKLLGRCTFEIYMLYNREIPPVKNLYFGWYRSVPLQIYQLETISESYGRSAMPQRLCTPNRLSGFLLNV